MLTESVFLYSDGTPVQEGDLALVTCQGVTPALTQTKCLIIKINGKDCYPQRLDQVGGGLRTLYGRSYNYTYCVSPNNKFEKVEATP